MGEWENGRMGEWENQTMGVSWTSDGGVSSDMFIVAKVALMRSCKMERGSRMVQDSLTQQSPAVWS
ncbi:MAG: hypothetical protein EHM43_11690 [Ignavibacteriae bacterium]|nr:MAG: hypothetical protein EHM43_11690 [Ignavibacteriota bacterium]